GRDRAEEPRDHAPRASRRARPRARAGPPRRARAAPRAPDRRRPARLRLFLGARARQGQGDARDVRRRRVRDAAARVPLGPAVRARADLPGRRPRRPGDPDLAAARPRPGRVRRDGGHPRRRPRRGVGRDDGGGRPVGRDTTEEGSVTTVTTTYEPRLEETTELALHEKGKLIKSLRRFDMVLFTVCAFVGLDTLGTVASNGPQGFFWLVFLAIFFVLPYALALAEIGSSFTEEGGPYAWMKLAWGRLVAGLGPVLYWVTNPFWVGGSLAFIATDAWRANVSGLGHGTWGDYLFKLAFIWISIGVAIVSLRYGKWIPNVGAFLRFFTLGFVSITVVVYGIEHGFHGFSGGDASPTLAVFIGLVPVLLFNYVGFELQNGAAEEMKNPARDVPVSVVLSGILGVLSYVIPILGILLVLPLNEVTGIGGFVLPVPHGG